MDDFFYELSIEKATYDPKQRKLILSHYAARLNGMNPDDNIRKILVHGKTKDVMFERTTGNKYLYLAFDEDLLLEIVKP